VSNITLPRAAEQVRKALELALESQFTPDDVECEHGMHYRDCSNNVCVMRDCKAALAALDAALAEPEHIHTCGPDCQKPLCVNRRREIAAAVEAEREACAEIADSQIKNTALLTVKPGKSAAAWDIANAIRARGSK
jgi:hypothetical protein